MALFLGHKIGVFLSDISGAFDRVRAARLVAKALNAGVGTKMAKFIAGYLEPRVAVVVVEGICSEEFVIENQVFQGTVLGPPFWNLFFADVQKVIEAEGAQSSVYADDLNAFKTFDSETSNDDILADMGKCADKVHEWGSANQVLFDPSKEGFCVMHRRDHEGNDFTLLGVSYDPQLTMFRFLKSLGRRMSNKLAVLLKTKWVHSQKELISQYKTHVMSLCEMVTPAIYHAAPSYLDKIDRVQRHFLKAINMSERDAFLNHNLVPQQLRRDIGMLGALHKCATGQAHPEIADVFPMHKSPLRATNTHTKQLHDHFDTRNNWPEWMQRSVYGLIKVYNELPQSTVDQLVVSRFQAVLTEKARISCRSDTGGWQLIYDPIVNNSPVSSDQLNHRIVANLIEQLNARRRAQEQPVG